MYPNYTFYLIPRLFYLFKSSRVSKEYYVSYLYYLLNTQTVSSILIFLGLQITILIFLGLQITIYPNYTIYTPSHVVLLLVLRFLGLHRILSILTLLSTPSHVVLLLVLDGWLGSGRDC